MTDDDDKNKDPESIDSILFSGLLYRLINEPEDIRNSPLLFELLSQSENLPDIDTKIQSFKTAMTKIDQVKDRDGVFSKLESFLEGSRYNLIFLDKNFHHIIHNKKSERIVDQLFDNGNSNTLKSKYLDLISLAKDELDEKNQRIISIPNAIQNKFAFYLISNRHHHDEDQDFNIILIPNFGDQEFKLQETLIRKYQLTNKETLVLTKLVSGHNVQKISEQISISTNTVRSHLKSVYRKTSTKSQSDLIRLFLNHESQYLDSYFEPTKPAVRSDKKTVSSDLFVTLNKGNKICYRDYGPKEGRPLVIFHNLFGSRFNIPYQYSEILKKTNRRVIIPEKPGYGLSDVVPDFSKQWSAMFDEFITKLELSSFTLLGNVTGSASVIEYASTYPEKLNSLILTSPLFLNQKNQIKLLEKFPANAAKIVALSTKMALSTHRFWIKCIQTDTEKYIKKMFKHYAGHKELPMLENKQYIDRIVLNFTESQRNNSIGSGQDALYSFTPLNLDLTNITVPFDIWIGDEDSLISVASAKEICEPIPNKTFHVREGYGEDIFYHLFEEIIQ